VKDGIYAKYAAEQSADQVKRRAIFQKIQTYLKHFSASADCLKTKLNW